MQLTSLGICNKTDSSAPYLPNSVSCAVSQCAADTWALDLVLGTLQLYCTAVQCDIPDNVLSSAYAAASGTSATSAQSTRKPASSAKPTKSASTTTKTSDGGQALTRTYSSTVTRTTTDGSGQTLEVIVPIVAGPSGVATGSIYTSTLGETASSADTSASVASSTSTAAASSAALQTTSLTSTAAPRQTKSPTNGDGSPFTNEQATGVVWTVSGSLLGLGAVAALFAGL